MLEPSLLLVVLLVTIVAADINPGEIGLQFFGNEFAHTQLVPNFPTTDMSITFRIKASSGHILNYGRTTASGTFDADHLALKSANSLVVSRGTGTAWSTGVNFADNQWHALGLTWKMSTGETKLYKDGVIVGTTVLSRGAPFSVNGFLVLGQVGNCPNGCFTAQTGLIGTIADMTLWQKVLSADQISYLSTNSPSGDETDLISYWPLHANVGATGPDKTGGNDIMIAGPSWSKDVGMKDASVSLVMNKNDVAIAPLVSDLPTGDFTIEFWIKSSTTDDSVILSYYVNGATNPYPFVIHNPSQVKVVHNSEEMRTESNLATGAWNHAAFTWQQQTGRLKLVLNGALAYPPAWLPEADYDLMPTLDLGGVLPARPTRIVLGNKLLCSTSPGSCLSTGAGFDGQLQDVRIWNVVRSLSDITASKDHSVSTPFPASLLLYWKLDELDTSRTLTDAAKANTATLNVPMWKNNLIAPPFPTLQEVNDKVSALKAQMAELLDFVKDVLEPAEPTAAITTAPDGSKGFAVNDESKCDRRYKYQCKFATQATAASNNAASGAAASMSNMLLVQQGASAVSHSELSAVLEPAIHHRHQTQQQQHPQEQEIDMLVQTEGSSTDSVPAIVFNPSTNFVVSRKEVAEAAMAPVIIQSGERKRHAWTTPQGVTSANTNVHSVGASGKSEVTRMSEDTARPTRRGGRHAWTAGAQIAAA